MTSGYSNAVGWLQQISGVDPQANYADKDAKDHILSDLHDMKDAETSARVLPPPRRSARLSGRNGAHTGVARLQQRSLNPSSWLIKPQLGQRKGKVKCAVIGWEANTWLKIP